VIEGRARVGDVEIVAIADAAGSFASVHGAFPGLGAEPEAAARREFPELFDGDAWTLRFRSYVLRGPEQTILVDTGLGPPPGSFLPERQAWLLDDLDPGTIDLVVLTHLHVDHIGWCTDEAGRPTFARARYAVPRADWEAFGTAPGRAELIARRVTPLAEHGVMDPIEPGAAVEVAPGVEAFPTPGHTPGHVSLRIRSRGEEAVILGDVCVHPAQVADPGLAYTFDVDPARAAATRAALLRSLEEGGTLVAAGHFPVAGFGRVVAGAWRPE
jgi:glyoxylase-like metal-dependent hydrolase (beta-lactamase superfamily II)